MFSFRRSSSRSPCLIGRTGTVGWWRSPARFRRNCLFIQESRRFEWLRMECLRAKNVAFFVLDEQANGKGGAPHVDTFHHALPK